MPGLGMKNENQSIIVEIVIDEGCVRSKSSLASLDKRGVFHFPFNSPSPGWSTWYKYLLGYLCTWVHGTWTFALMRYDFMALSKSAG